MQTPTRTRKRTIVMSEMRSSQIALAAAALGLPDSETFIQAAISAALVTVAENDPPLGLLLSRAGGESWERLQAIAKARHEAHEPSAPEIA